jgi:catechol-2,3-dioxygenase
MNHVIAQMGLRVPDVAAYTEHVEATLGVEAIEADATGARLALPGQSPCLVVTAGDGAGLEYVGFWTDEANLAEVADRAEAAGVQVGEGRVFGSVRLLAPNGLAVELAAGSAEPRNTQRREGGPTVGSLDHVSLQAADLDSTVGFFVDVLGFRVVDSVGSVRHWLSCGPNHHTVAVFAGTDSLHHYAFEADNVLELQRLGDRLALRGQNFVWGPGRHALGANIFTYHLDPAGALLELTSDMIQIPDDGSWVAQVWSPDTPASAVMWGPYPTPEFREMTIPIVAGEAQA